MVVSDKAKNIDPNLFVIKWFEYKSTGIEEFEIGRGIKKFTGQIDFSFRSVTDPKKSLLSQSENIANFCIGSASYKYGKDKEPITLITYGPPARVLDAILANTDDYYHEDIIDWHSMAKLKFIENQETEVMSKLISQEEILKKKIKEIKKDLEEELQKKIKEVEGTQAEIPKFLQDEIKQNPLAFKSAATKDVIDEGVYKYLTPAEILTQRIAQTNTSIPQLSKALGFDISTVYHHVRGTRDVDRKAALRYAHYFNCDPADILFPPIKISLTGRSDLIKKDGQVDIDYTKSENVLCPRDFYSKAREIKAIKITSPSSVYNDHIAYYYYSNKKETDCENKVCFIGVKEKGFMDEPYTNYYIGIYENFRGQTKILNADPYRNKETILDNPEIEFITPIIAFVAVDKVKFAPIVDVKFKEINENEQLQKLEKQLEMAEQHWWIENQKLSSGKKHYPMSKAKNLDKMYRDLRELRLKVDQYRRKITEKSFESKNKDTDKKMKKIFDYIKEDVYAPKRA
jgi:hypothetical protein